MYKVVHAMAPNVSVLDEEFETEQEALEAMYEYTCDEVSEEVDYLQFPYDDEVQLRMTYYAVVEVKESTSNVPE